MIGLMKTFVPRAGLRNGHLMTIFGWGNPRHFPHLPPPTIRYFDVAEGTRVMAHCHWHADPAARPTIIALHGLNASSDAHYMRGIASKAFGRGMNVIRLNQRNCGNTEHLSRGLFHSGLTEDARYVIEELEHVDGLKSLALAGYSLGGNLALKLAGEYGDHPPPTLHAVAAVSPILEISQCVHALERPSNVLYEWNFVRDLRRRMRRKEQVSPGHFDLALLARVRSVRQFDETFTAPHFGFRDAEDYYHRASAMRLVDRVRVPTLIISAEDDPFVPSGPFRDPSVRDNPAITMKLSTHGGHCGFVAARHGDSDGYWAEDQIVDWVSRHASDAPIGAHEQLTTA